MHCFTGSADELDNYLKADCYIGITGWLCDEARGGALRELVPLIPDNRIMIETDGPFLRPHNAPENARLFPDTLAALKKYRRRNEPALLPFVLNRLAELRRQSPQELAQRCSANAQRLFGFDMDD